MALDKLVDSTQLDANLTTVANAIRAKGGTSGSLSFPQGMASAIAAIPGGSVEETYFVIISVHYDSRVGKDNVVKVHYTSPDGFTSETIVATASSHSEILFRSVIRNSLLCISSTYGDASSSELILFGGYTHTRESGVCFIVNTNGKIIA